MRYDVVIIGGGLAGMTAAVALRKAGKEVIVVSEGLSLHETPRKEFVSLGGTLLPGDSVISGEWDGNRLLSVRTRNLEGTPLEAGAFILATGKFFSRGLISTMDRIYEPVFGADVEYDEDRDNWVNPDFHAEQPFEHFGVKTEDCRVVIGGITSENLFAAGEILAGEVDIIKSAEEVCRKLM